MKHNPKDLYFSLLHDIYGQETKIMINVENINDIEDEIRDVEHFDWKQYWSNVAENTFSSSVFKTDEEAKKWLISIGIKYNSEEDE